ncbi:MAG TPA: glycoside hydrolase family 2 TIM barrel-domain containing protein, partial [Gemmatimonadales bacterium]|nr:glycoside hydrolase family 2 TIM barrel-domain containing protein [Gemmatimonadales bacterium]
MPKSSRHPTALAVAFTLLASAVHAQSPDTIPLPEQPRPDFARAEWLNLNGRWRFAFDSADQGVQAGWSNGQLPGDAQILVPFSWAAPLSGIGDTTSIGWYARSISIPEAWKGKRLFLVIGASDWRTSAWLDGDSLGTHQGGYTPFSFELTKLASPGTAQQLAIRVDDSPHPFKLEGKQGYGEAKGIWQTIYLEARGTDPLDAIHFTPHADLNGVDVDVRLLEPAPLALKLRVAIGSVQVTRDVRQGTRELHFSVAMRGARRWTLDDPYLYDATVSLTGGPGFIPDTVHTYFGMRTVSVTSRRSQVAGRKSRDLRPGTMVTINGQPTYLQMALDQAYHPDGFYTFPTDSALKEEILRARQLGLNGLREHIKIESPRKLYWADKLGVLIMADVPNWWGPPDSAAFREHDAALRGMIDRDYNHPSIFSWVLFNESWGLISRVDSSDRYLPATQQRVAADYRLAKSLDSTRLVEDNSVCCDWPHTETDLNSWHSYLPGWRWASYDRQISDSTFPGSSWNFTAPWKQGRQPMLNSEFGNVWGYDGSTGDVDWSWDYHRAVDAFRRNPKIAGWLYTELHDVINEWNGYVRFDRTSKETGFGALVDGMTLQDLHAPLYIAIGDSALATTTKPGEQVEVPLYASFNTGSTALPDSLTLRFDLSGWNTLGERKTWDTASRRIPYHPWMSESLAPFAVTMPAEPAVAVLAVRLEDATGSVLQRNFTTFVVEGEAPDSITLADGRHAIVSRVPASRIRASHWSLKQWAVMDSLKMDGAGSGYFEYAIPFPKGLTARDMSEATFLVEASAKRLNGKDRDSTASDNGDYMRGGGLHDRSRNPNSYPMTSEDTYPSAITVSFNGHVAGRVELTDDPADSRGILSWHAQPHDGHLHEAGSYGQLIRVPIPADAIAEAERTGEMIVRMEVSDALPGGLAIYGAKFGRYPVEPTVV